MFTRLKQVRLATFAVSLIALIATACGGNADVANSPTAPTETSSETTATVAPTETSSKPTATVAPTEPLAETDATAATEQTASVLTEIKTGWIRIGDVEQVKFEATEIDFEADIGTGPMSVLLGLWGDGNALVLPLDIDAWRSSGEAIIITSRGMWEATGIKVANNAEIFSGAGDATSLIDGSTTSFAFELAFGTGTSTFEIVGTEAIVRGALGSHSFTQMEFLLENHPEVNTLVLADIRGSVNDEVNVETGRLVRNAGLSTHVPADGEIYSGGVDLFAAGVQRTVESGAILGVHAWCCGPNGESAHELGQDDPVHATQLAYFSEMLGDTAGPSFYFFTLESAPFDGMHTMTDEELAEHLLTAP